MGFIFNILFDAAVLSSAAAGLRRTTGINLAQMARARVQHPGWQAAIQGYFGAGEWIVTKSIEFVQSKKPQAPPTSKGGRSISDRDRDRDKTEN